MTPLVGISIAFFVILGYVAGILATLFVIRRQDVGEMVISTKDPNTDLYSLNLTVDPETFKKQKYVKFRVKVDGRDQRR